LGTNSNHDDHYPIENFKKHLMVRKKIRFGIIGLGLMGKEFGSAIARWCHLLNEYSVPQLVGICDVKKESWKWFTDNFPDLKIVTQDYHKLLESEDIDAIYCAVPHHLQEQLYCDIINAKKHLLGEKPFGIDLIANRNILNSVKANPDIIVRCSSEFPYYPAAARVVNWLKEKKYGRLIEVRAGFHHASDLNPLKPINWKRQNEFNGEYGCMGDLGMHTLHIPYNMKWKTLNVYANLQKIIDSRPDGKGRKMKCDTWDNAVLTCTSLDPFTGKEFTLVIETKRIAPGATNSWFIEIYGTEGSATFSTQNPKVFRYLENGEKEQGWTSIDVGSQSYIPSITGGIFEFGFSDAFQQMMGAYMQEFNDEGSQHLFRNVRAEETYLSHQLFTAALESHKTKCRIDL
jgi:predicted dehydrogenase